jgi:hypothetical protein
MIWVAALMMAAQAVGAVGAPQSSPAVTAQQKQELSNYNFKGAAAALNAQTNQAVPKPSPSTPIPPLQVPALTSQRPIVQSSPAGGTAAEKGSEVPPNWKPPHAELNYAAVSALAVAQQWETGVGTPTPGPDGRVLYVFGQGMPVMVCAPLRVCAVELQAGEHLQSQPQIGDSRRWGNHSGYERLRARPNSAFGRKAYRTRPRNRPHHPNRSTHIRCQVGVGPHSIRVSTGVSVSRR